MVHYIVTHEDTILYYTTLTDMWTCGHATITNYSTLLVENTSTTTTTTTVGVRYTNHTRSSGVVHVNRHMNNRYCCCSSSYDDDEHRVDQTTLNTTTTNNNKRGMDSALFEYIIDHSREDPILKELRRVTAERFPKAAKMAVGPEQGAFLGWLVDLMKVRTAIEIGVFTGYSSICIAKAMVPGSTLFALDRDPVALETAREFWEYSGVSDGIDARCGNAIESLRDIDQRCVDFAFVDANKRGYRDYYEALLPMMRVGGVIAIDNVLWYGRVADPGVTDRTTESLRELNRYIREDDRVSMTLVPIGDGIMLCTKK